jgi:hypothetical protein
MRAWSVRLVCLCFAFLISGAAQAWAQNVGASQSGAWSNGSTWTTGTVPGSSNNVFIGSTTPAGAAMTATVTLTQDQSAGNVYLGYGAGTSGTLDLGGYTLTIGGMLVIGQNGGSGSLVEAGGSFTAPNVDVYSANAVAFGSGDVVSNLTLSGGASATTAGLRNVTGNATVNSGSSLNLGAAMNLSGSLNVYGSGSTLNLDGYSLSANTLFLGWNGSSPVAFDRGSGTPGTLALANLDIANGQVLSLIAGDSTPNVTVSGAGSALSTATTANVAGNATVQAGGTLNLGAAMNLSGSLNVYGSGSTLNLDGHSLSANTLFLGWNGSSPVNLINPGTISVGNLDVGNGTAFTLLGGSLVNGQIDLQGGSVLTIQPTNGTGLTLNGGLTLDPSSLDLIFNLNSAPNWDFRWKDPSSASNWISTIESLIADHQIVIMAPQGYEVIDQGGYTYIAGNFSSAVPEPSTLFLAGSSLAALTTIAAWRHCRRRFRACPGGASEASGGR